MAVAKINFSTNALLVKKDISALLKEITATERAIDKLATTNVKLDRSFSSNTRSSKILKQAYDQLNRSGNITINVQSAIGATSDAAAQSMNRSAAAARVYARELQNVKNQLGGVGGFNGNVSVAGSGGGNVLTNSLLAARLSAGKGLAAGGLAAGGLAGGGLAGGGLAGGGGFAARLSKFMSGGVAATVVGAFNTFVGGGGGVTPNVGVSNVGRKAFIGFGGGMGQVGGLEGLNENFRIGREFVGRQARRANLIRRRPGRFLGPGIAGGGDLISKLGAGLGGAAGGIAGQAGGALTALGPFGVAVAGAAVVLGTFIGASQRAVRAMEIEVSARQQIGSTLRGAAQARAQKGANIISSIDVSRRKAAAFGFGGVDDKTISRLIPITGTTGPDVASAQVEMGIAGLSTSERALVFDASNIAFKSGSFGSFTEAVQATLKNKSAIKKTARGKPVFALRAGSTKLASAVIGQKTGTRPDPRNLVSGLSTRANAGSAAADVGVLRRDEIRTKIRANEFAQTEFAEDALNRQEKETRNPVVFALNEARRQALIVSEGMRRVADAQGAIAGWLQDAAASIGAGEGSKRTQAAAFDAATINANQAARRGIE